MEETNEELATKNKDLRQQISSLEEEVAMVKSRSRFVYQIFLFCFVNSHIQNHFDRLILKLKIPAGQVIVPYDSTLPVLIYQTKSICHASFEITLGIIRKLL